MRPENSSFEKAGQASVAAEGKPNRHSELRDPAGSNAVQAVNSFDASGRVSQNHEADGALKKSHAQMKDSSRIKAHDEIKDRPSGVPTAKSGSGVHSDPSVGDDGSAGWKAKGKYQQTNATVKNYKLNSDPTPSLKPSRKGSLSSL